MCANNAKLINAENWVYTSDQSAYLELVQNDCLNEKKQQKLLLLKFSYFYIQGKFYLCFNQILPSLSL